MLLMQHETLLKGRSLGVVSVSHLTRTNLEPRSGREPNGLIRKGARLFQCRSGVFLSASRGTRNGSEKQIVSEEELSCRLVLTEIPVHILWIRLVDFTVFVIHRSDQTQSSVVCFSCCCVNIRKKFRTHAKCISVGFEVVSRHVVPVLGRIVSSR